MRRKLFTKEDFSGMRESVVLMHGYFEPSFFNALKKRKDESFYVLEGRPRLASGKSCCTELLKRKITPTLIADNMPGFLFSKGLVKEVFISAYAADRKGAVCPIGGLILAVLAQWHKVPVIVHFKHRKKPIQLLGASKEITTFNGVNVAPKGIKAYVPLIEWISRRYITRIEYAD